MKRKVTKIMPDGSKHIIEEDDQAPVHHKNILDAKKQGTPPAKQYLDRVADQGNRGDTELAHVNPWEEALLKKLGGAGTRNPHTGLKQFYTAKDIESWYPNYLGRSGTEDPTGLAYWQGQAADTTIPESQLWNAFSTAAKAPGAGEIPTTWNPTSNADVASWYSKDLGRVASPEEINYWSNYKGDASSPYAAFLAGAGNEVAGRTPPSVGLPTTGINWNDWYQRAWGRSPGADEVAYWQGQAALGIPVAQLWAAFQTAGKTAGEKYTGWSPISNPNGIDIPLDIMPTSTSNSSSYSGLPAEWQSKLLTSLMPQLQSSITDMPGNIDKYTGEALGSYQQMMQNALRKNIPDAIAGLANRGILSSTEGNKILSEVMSNAATDASTKGYTTAMQSALLKAGMPSILAQIADLGKSTSSASSSYSEDPTQMYKTLASVIQSMMG